MTTKRLQGDWGMAVGDVVRTKKAHPCGADSWQVTRVGADVKMRCTGCGRIVMLPRQDFIKRVKTVIQRAQPEEEGKDGQF
jgi:hypothetical protein